MWEIKKVSTLVAEGFLCFVVSLNSNEMAMFSKNMNVRKPVAEAGVNF